MKNIIRIGLIALVSLTTSSYAQIVLQDFSNVVDNDLNYFYGTWESTGDTGGTYAPNASFFQGAGYYEIAAANSTDNSNSFLEFFFFPTAGSILTNTYISVTAQALAGNTATTFAITLLDAGANTARAAFDLSLFPTGGFSTQIVALTFSGPFNPLNIDSMRISGDQLGGSAIFKVSFDQISAVASAVPEPATYALLAGLACFGLIVIRRRLVKV